MVYILQVSFPYSGPWGKDMSEAMKGMANSIAQEKGILWKIWIENKELGTVGGIYLFKTREEAEVYNKMHTARLEEAGFKAIEARFSDVNVPLSLIDHAPLK